MEPLPARALALIRETIHKMVEDSLDPDPANVAEIEVLARLSGSPQSQTLDAWLHAARARSSARRTREASAALRERAGRVRVRRQLHVIDGRTSITMG